jgi:hypothetical protein
MKIGKPVRTRSCCTGQIVDNAITARDVPPDMTPIMRAGMALMLPFRKPVIPPNT